MFQTIAAIELYHAQREVANYLELAYLNLADHPDAAKEVRDFRLYSFNTCEILSIDNLRLGTCTCTIKTRLTAMP
ncbi:hypothetical protein DPMN_190499 [Dreissena polymorpha]|uniref:Uncharacterized protein n=1 Tax=Dreissena polymorpha TaxID=45954 RepID=A0A9D4IBT2_DREPO|nr:hypothetical protein DPMN_190499 [Dreissena polymorpha]